MLSEPEIESYVATQTPDQQKAVRTLRQLVLGHHPQMVEVVDTGKWFTGMLTYSLPSGLFCFALGPRKDGSTSFHMMPLYMSATFNERHGAALKKFLTGKSCIKFKRIEDAPMEALEDIVGNGVDGLEKAIAERGR